LYRNSHSRSGFLLRCRVCHAAHDKAVRQRRAQTTRSHCASCERPASECTFPVTLKEPHQASSWCVECHELHFRSGLTPRQRRREVEMWQPIPRRRR
jgi:hypothetical protein